MKKILLYTALLLSALSIRAQSSNRLIIVLDGNQRQVSMNLDSLLKASTAFNLVSKRVINCIQASGSASITATLVGNASTTANITYNFGTSAVQAFPVTTYAVSPVLVGAVGGITVNIINSTATGCTVQLKNTGSSVVTLSAVTIVVNAFYAY